MQDVMHIFIENLPGRSQLLKRNTNRWYAHHYTQNMLSIIHQIIVEQANNMLKIEIISYMENYLHKQRNILNPPIFLKGTKGGDLPNP